MSFRHAFLAFSLLAAGAAADDWIVDASGVASPLTDVNAAMAVARPGDRILVMPGDYPAFQFSRGVHVHGLGDSPGDVRITRVDYHVSIPNIGYDTSLTNLEVGDPQSLGEIPVSGNELPPGVLVMDGVIVNGGVFLGGGHEGFALLMTNSSIRPGAGEGFAGAAAYLGGENNRVDIIDSEILGWDAGFGVPAGDAVLLAGGTTARIANSVLAGGRGADGALGQGGSGLVDGGLPLPVSVRLDGASVVSGGDGSTGGHGVDVAGQVDLGTADVHGGLGSVDGAAFADAQASFLPVGLHLRTEPELFGASRGATLTSGDLLTFALPTQAAVSAIAVGLDLDLPMPAATSPLATPFLFFQPGDSISFAIPAVADVPAVLVFAQGWVRDPASNAILASNPAAVRVDLTGFLP